MHGDVGDYAPIQQLWKSTEVVALAKALGVPKEIIDRPPTDGLTANGKDEDQLGLPYAKLDPILELVDKYKNSIGVTSTIANKTGETIQAIVNVSNRVKSTEFKRNHPKILTREDLGV